MYNLIRPRGYKTFFVLNSTEHGIFLLINVKMPSTVGILTFMSRKNSILSLSEPEKCWISWYFHTYEHLKFHAQVSWAWKKFYNLGARQPKVANAFWSKLYVQFSNQIQTSQKWKMLRKPVQTQIRLLLKERSDQGMHWLQIKQAFRRKKCKAKLHCFHDYSKGWGVLKFGTTTLYRFMIKAIWSRPTQTLLSEYSWLT